ncbi:hypothetical protein BU14_0219s0022 [Porphyra umbilicalis]|uniref:Succinate dehydrogenase assembly factor 3 n=1 Tax=Porphyra umbilicalis TaxID=2786 RepID=A0A1X6P4M6_PORUM|nr:hypothetical protein BU14_0219s0022 [Porphyra umbilicalis]|eukprot:OSX75822.1 hypothetical protein BU14_0219s0022 [Porphyra umbilicalis]
MPVPPPTAAAAAAAAAAGGLGPRRRDVLGLYRSLLRIHAAVLPAAQRALGDRYVREEFKAHKEVEPAQADAFMQTWQEYWVHLARARGGPVGRDLDGGTSEALSEEQTAKLDELAAAARAASPRLGDAAADADDDGPAAPRGGKTE